MHGKVGDLTSQLSNPTADSDHHHPAPSLALWNRVLLVVTRAGGGRGRLRRCFVVCAGSKSKDGDDEEQFGDVFHVRNHRSRGDEVDLNLNELFHGNFAVHTLIPSQP